MPISPAGSTNLSAIGVPNVYTQLIPPSPVLNAAETDIIMVVGTASAGPVNKPVVIGGISEQVSTFGIPAPIQYDMGTQVYNATLQGANNFICIRVTDGSDTSSTADVLDGSAAVGVTLTSFYTGTLYNTLTAAISNGSGSTSANPTFRLTVYLAGGVPEVFDNIGGTGATFWTNLANAVNLGQSNARPPSKLVTATLQTYISSVTVTEAGSYATLPTFGTTGPGTGAVLAGTMKGVTATPVAAGSGYAPADTIVLTGGTHTINSILTVATTKLVSVAVNAGGSNYIVGDKITLAGGTFSIPAILTVNTVSAGAVVTFTISTGGSYSVNSTTFTQSATSGVGTGATFNTGLFGILTETVSTPGRYTILPSSPVSQGSSSGSGTGGTHTVLWGVYSISVTSGGTGYTSSSILDVTGGGGTGGAQGTLAIGSASSIENPASYSFSGGTSGNNNVTDDTLIGSDVLPRTGMYAGRNTSASIGILADQTDSTKWTSQVSFGLFEGKYMIVAMPPGYQDDLSGAISLLQNTGILSYAFKLMLGDYILISDPFNSIQRYVTQQGFVAGILATLSPEQSSLNKPMNGIIATAKTAESGVYSNADLLQLMTGGIDVVTRPIPLGNTFGCRLGVNTSGVFSIGDNYTRMNNFLAATFTQGLGPFIGQPQTPKVRAMAKSTLDTFLGNLFILNIIGDVNFPGDQSKAYKVILDATNNPSTRVAQGFMQADVRVVLFSIILDFIVNLEANQGVTIQTLPPQNNQ